VKPPTVSEYSGAQDNDVAFATANVIELAVRGRNDHSGRLPPDAPGRKSIIVALYIRGRRVHGKAYLTNRNRTRSKESKSSVRFCRRPARGR
jgi:hypothetical protein